MRVLRVLVDAREQLTVRVCSTMRGPACPHCEAACARAHDRRDNEVHDLEVSGQRVVLEWSRRRLVIEGCERQFLEGHPAFERSPASRLARRVVTDARMMTLASAARRDQVGWHMINALVPAWAGKVGEPHRTERCRVLLVEETSIGKRHRYAAVFMDAQTVRTPPGMSLAFDADVFRARLVLLRRPDNLTETERRRLHALPDKRPRLIGAFEVFGELRGFYLAADHDAAIEASDRFADLYRTAQLPEFSDTFHAFLACNDEILVSHHTWRLRNGRLDSTNNLLGVLRRSAHNFTNHADFEALGLLLTQSTPPNPAAHPTRDNESKNLVIPRRPVFPTVFQSVT